MFYLVLYISIISFLSFFPPRHTKKIRGSPDTRRSRDPFTPHDPFPALIFHVLPPVGDRTAADTYKRRHVSTTERDNMRPMVLADPTFSPRTFLRLLLLRLNDVYSSTPWCTTCTRESRPSRDSLSVVADGRVLRAHAYPVASSSSSLAGTTVKQRRGPTLLSSAGTFAVKCSPLVSISLCVFVSLYLSCPRSFSLSLFVDLDFFLSPSFARN